MKQEYLEIIFDRDDWVCQYPGCNKRATEVGHFISQYKGGRAYMKREFNYLFDIQLSKDEVDYLINHPLNGASVCNHKPHNDHFAVSIAGHPIEARKIVEALFREEYAYEN